MQQGNMNFVSIIPAKYEQDTKNLVLAVWQVGTGVGWRPASAAGRPSRR